MVRSSGPFLERSVLLKPDTAYRFLAKQPVHGGDWLGWRKLLLIALVLGCTMSVVTSTTLTLRLAGPAAIYWSYVPLAEIAALASVCWYQKSPRSFSEIVDLFLAGHGPWLLWLIGLCIIWSFIPPIRAFDVTKFWMYGAGPIVLVWSAYIDFCFFRFIMRRNPAAASRDLFLQRLVSWTLIVTVFGWPAIPPELASGFGP